MPTSRSYQDACGIARALDVVGERWALLVVRELLLGPQRFSELRRVLSSTSSNVLSDRLRELEGHGVIRRRKLPPPAASWVYELTPRGHQLEPILLALGDWGLHVTRPSPPVTLSPASVLLYLRKRARPDPAATDSVIEAQLNSQFWALRTCGGNLTVEAGQPPAPAATITTDPFTFNELIGNPGKLHDAIRLGTAMTEGDLAALERLVREVAPAELDHND